MFSELMQCSLCHGNSKTHYVMHYSSKKNTIITEESSCGYFVNQCSISLTFLCTVELKTSEYRTEIIQNCGWGGVIFHNTSCYFQGTFMLLAELVPQNRQFFHLPLPWPNTIQNYRGHQHLQDNSVNLRR